MTENFTELSLCGSDESWFGSNCLASENDDKFDRCNSQNHIKEAEYEPVD